METKENNFMKKKHPEKAVHLTPGGKTRIVVKYDCGFSNTLYIRGSGANLNWNKGQKLQNVARDEWVWETSAPFKECEFKVLLNDVNYEVGENHHLTSGMAIQYTPKF
jgi:hypothetical protein